MIAYQIILLQDEWKEMTRKEINLAHMDVAYRYSKLSHAKRAKVGAIIVRDDRILSIGYNGTPPKWDNSCEIETDNGLITKPEVLHAEANCIAKIAKSTESSDGADMYITLSPCFECSKQIFAAGIKRLYYREQYRNTNGLDFLKKAGVIIEQI